MTHARRHERILVTAAALLSVVSCGGPPPRPVLPLPPECELVSTRARTDTVTVALPDRVEPNYAPWAQTTGERILFGHLYETLVTVNCLGEIQPLLSDVWQRSDGGRRWTFQLMKGVRFWDGSPVTARDVAWSWQDAMSRATPIDSVTVTGDNILHVYFGLPQRDFPRILCGPAFSVAKPLGGSSWLVGSGPYRVTYGRSHSTRNTFIAEPVSGRGSVLQFIENTAPDARDVLRRTDLMITSDPAVVEYAQGQAGMMLLPLEWDRAYVFLSTSRIRELRRGASVEKISSEVSERLARDAVRGDARACRKESWWVESKDCGRRSEVDFPPMPKGGLETSNRHILYDEDDPIARDLAERIVALAGTDPSVSADAFALTAAVPGLGDGARVTAEGVGGPTMTSSLRAGIEFGYVVTVPIRPYDACDEARLLGERVPWLVSTPLRDAVLPLVETRPHAIIARDRVRVAVDWYGNILLGSRASAGW